MTTANKAIRPLRGTATLAAMLLVATIGPSAGALAANACSAKRFTAVPVAITRDPAVLVPVTLAGRTVYMVLDMQMGFSLLQREAVRSFGLAETVLPLAYRDVHIGDERVTQYVRIQDVLLSELKFAQLDFLMVNDLDLPQSPDPSRPVVGLMGMDPFGYMDLELDLPARNLSLYAQNRCAAGVMGDPATVSTATMHFSSMHNYYFPLWLDGQRINATLSTASPSSALHRDAAQALFAVDTNGSASTYRSGELAAANFSVRNVEIRLIRSPLRSCEFAKAVDNGAAGYKGCDGPVPLYLGLDLLQQMHVYLATKERKIYFRQANPGAAPTL